eukprot:SAG11_NODE_302_length_11005_cov_12.491748_4_plen_89_part_00
MGNKSDCNLVAQTALCADRPYIKRMWPYLKHVAADEEERQNQKQIFAALAARKQLSKVQELMRNGWLLCIVSPFFSAVYGGFLQYDGG